MTTGLIEQAAEEIIVPEQDLKSFLEHIGWDMEQVMRGEFPDWCESLLELQLAIIYSDGPLWAYCFLQNPTDEATWGKKAPWTFFPYQIPSMRWQGSLIHYDGAEVGKTFEIIAKASKYAACTPGGSGLIGAPETDQLTPMINGIMDQFESGELKGLVKKHDKQPHHTITFKNGFELFFRPSKFDGRTYRGKHIKTFAFRDEAAVDKDPRTWSEFHRALEPGCIFGAYSVPNGVRDREFYRLGQQAKAETQGMVYPSDRGGWLAGPVDPGHLRYFHWPKTLMPEPFWTEERKKFYINLFGGEDSQGYKHNILGEDGDPESTIFPTDKFEMVVKEIPEYVSIRILVNEKQGEVSLQVYNINQGQKAIISEQHIPLSTFEIRETLNKYLSASGEIAEYFMGADLGYSNDFAEFWVSAVIGERNRLIARVQMLGVKYNYMREAFNLMDDIFDRGKNTMMSGVDIGGAGTAFYQELVAAYPDKHFEERCVGVQFGGKADLLGPDGEAMQDKNTQKPIRRRIKTLATHMLVKGMQELTDEYPADPEIIRDFTGHTSHPGQDGDEIYSKVNDHTIDAGRAGKWAYYRSMENYPNIEGASSGVSLAACAGAGGSGGVFLT